MRTAILFAAAAGVLFCGCQNQPQPEPRGEMIPIPVQNTVPSELTLKPQVPPGIPRVSNDAPTGGYAPTNVQAQFKIDVKDSTREVKVIRDTTDPYVITKPYMLKNADPYAVRSYLEAAVGARSVSTSPAQVTAVKFADGSGMVLVAAEEYRFKDSDSGKGIDSIVASLDRKGLTFAPEAGVYIYFPRISRAANLRDMLIKVGSHELDPQFAVSPTCILVDAELNALVIKAPRWSWVEMRKLLEKYDRPIPEVKVSYRVIEIYAENDDRIGVDFQSWKNNEGVDFFSAGTVVRRNWGTFFTSGVQDNGWNRTSYWDVNPKWNTRYLDFMTSIGKAKCLAQGVLVAQNRRSSQIEVSSGFFYDRTYYTAGATSIAEGCQEFTFADPNPDAILREGVNKIMPYQELVQLYQRVSRDNPKSISEKLIANMPEQLLRPIGYTMRVMGTQTGTNTIGDAIAALTEDQRNTIAGQMTQGLPASAAAALTTAILNATTSALSKYIGGYVKSDGSVVRAGYYNTNADQMQSSPGIIHGWLQYPMVTDGFKFDLKVTPVVTGKAAKLRFELDSISLLGWNADGSARTSNSGTATTVQVGLEPREFVIGGLRKSEAVRGNAGLPFFKDLPVIGRVLSTETESVKQSQLVVIAKVELSRPDDRMGADVKSEVGKIIKQVNKGVDSPVGNMFFQQYLLDEDRPDREKRLDKLSTEINDGYKEHR
ncbi:MAG: hypothetical protein IJT50_02365 [Lentisphaeria bacterium]|nr:hypothetical protein [Lentisphaeria bacterium]